MSAIFVIKKQSITLKYILYILNLFTIQSLCNQTVSLNKINLDVFLFLNSLLRYRSFYSPNLLFTSASKMVWSLSWHYSNITSSQYDIKVSFSCHSLFVVMFWPVTSCVLSLLPLKWLLTTRWLAWILFSFFAFHSQSIFFSFFVFHFSVANPI